MIGIVDLFWGPIMARSEGKRRRPWKRPKRTVNRKTWNCISLLASWSKDQFFDSNQSKKDDNLEEREEDMGRGCSKEDEGEEGCDSTVEHGQPDPVHGILEMHTHPSP